MHQNGTYFQLVEAPPVGTARVVPPSAGQLRILALLLVATLLSVGCTSAPEKPTQRDATAEQVYQLCTQCHGPQLQGKPDIAAPAVAGLPDWYIEAQLHKFKGGIRGSHFDDLPGMRMRPMAMSLTEADITAIAGLVSKLPVQESHPSLEGGNAEAGKMLFAPCTACHGPEAKGNPALKAPPLAQANDWYLFTQLHNFKHGVRGANPNDTTGAQMRPMAQGLADEQAMRDVVAYIGTL